MTTRSCNEIDVARGSGTPYVSLSLSPRRDRASEGGAQVGGQGGRAGRPRITVGYGRGLEEAAAGGREVGPSGGVSEREREDEVSN